MRKTYVGSYAFVPTENANHGSITKQVTVPNYWLDDYAAVIVYSAWYYGTLKSHLGMITCA